MILFTSLARLLGKGINWEALDQWPNAGRWLATPPPPPPDGLLERLLANDHAAGVRITVEAAGFRIVESDGAGPAIRCKACGMLSHHPQDVAQRYCAWCHKFHEPLTPAGGNKNP